MPTRPLERLMFAQGGLCFFCTKPLATDEASVEHLVPSARDGSNSDDNCVACCKSINSLLGSMSLKEKIRVVLNQRGDFKCPNGRSLAAFENDSSNVITAPAAAPKNAVVVPKKAAGVPKPDDTLAAVLKHLKGLKNAKPVSVKTLTSTIKALPLKLSNERVQAVVNQLKALGKITVAGTKVTYKL